MTFGPGESRKDVEIEILDDRRESPNKTFQVCLAPDSLLSDGVIGVLGTDVTRVSIFDDGSPRKGPSPTQVSSPNHTTLLHDFRRLQCLPKQ